MNKSIQKLDSERRDVIQSLVRPNRLFMPIFMPTPQLRYLNYENEEFWGYSLLWLMKKKWLGRSLKLDRRNGFIKWAEKFGDLLLALLNLCVEVELIAPKYKSPLLRFQMICFEIKNADLELSMQATTESSKIPSKRKDIQNYRQFVKSLREDNNCLAQKTQPHLFDLFDQAIEIARTFNQFDQKYWRGGLVKAYVTWINELNDPSVASVFQSNGNLYAVGKGGSKKLIF